MTLVAIKTLYFANLLVVDLVLTLDKTVGITVCGSCMVYAGDDGKEHESTIWLIGDYPSC